MLRFKYADVIFLYAMKKQISKKPSCLRTEDHAVNELILMMHNEYPAYMHLRYDWYNLYGKKIATGKFNKEKAIQGLVNIYVSRLAKYVRKNYGTSIVPPRLTIDQKTEVAEEALEILMDLFRYDKVKKGVKFIPKEPDTRTRREISKFF